MRLEIEINQKLHSEPSSTLFYGYYGCVADKNLRVYMFMEVMGENWSSLRVACPKFWGGRSFAERLLTYIRLLWQVDQLHQLGYIHCDLKLHNVFSKNGDYRNFSIGDYGLASQKVCFAGTEDWEPPEVDCAIPKLDSVIDIFDVASSFKQDAFASGMLIIMAELKREDTVIVRQAYRMLKERANGSAASYGEEESKFKQRIQKMLEKAWDANFNDSISDPTKFIFRLRFVQTVMGLIAFDHKKRLPVRAALIQMYTLYMALLNLRMHVMDIDDFWTKPQLLKNEMKEKTVLVKIRTLLTEQAVEIAANKVLI